jgi:hypothetical protein
VYISLGETCSLLQIFCRAASRFYLECRQSRRTGTFPSATCRRFDRENPQSRKPDRAREAHRRLEDVPPWRGYSKRESDPQGDPLSLCGRVAPGEGCRTIFRPIASCSVTCEVARATGVGKDKSCGWVRKLFADGAYAGHLLAWVKALIPRRGLKIEIVKRINAGFKILPKRWVVERAFAWLARCRPPCQRL